MITYKFDSKSAYLDFTEKSGLVGITKTLWGKTQLHYYIELTEDQADTLEDLIQECGAWVI